MKSIRLLLPMAALGLLSSLHAQYDADIPIEYQPPRKNTFYMGVRVLGGADVRFGQLGRLSATETPAPLGVGGTTRLYDDGGVGADAARAIEATAPKADGRYQTTATVQNDQANQVTEQSGSFLSYVEGQTRTWTYRYDDQVQPDGRTIAMHQYSAVSQGGSASGSSGSGAGFEFTLAHRFGTIGERIEWGVLLGGGLTDINAKTSGRVKSTLQVLTDLYDVKLPAGQTIPAAGYSAPSTGTFVSPSNTSYPNGLETTIPLGAAPYQRTTQFTPGALDVDGQWQVKGSYYLFRLGPIVRIPFTERIAVTASVGVAGAYVGTKYRADERTVVSDRVSLSTIDEKSQSEFMTGFYGDITAELWLNNRTGIYAGVAYERLGDYEQSLQGRTAKIDVGGSAGFRLGIMTRF